jgi:hypothetical protein
MGNLPGSRQMRFAAALFQEMEIGLFARKAEALNPELASRIRD